MTRYIKYKMYFLIIVFIIAVVLFPKFVYADSVNVDGVTYTYVTPDDGNDGADFKDVNIVLTVYGGESLGARIFG